MHPRKLTNPREDGRVATKIAQVWPQWLLLVSALACWPRAPLDGYEPVKLGLSALLLGGVLLAGVRGPKLTPVARRMAALGALLLLPAALTAPDLPQFWLGTPQRAQGGLALALCGLAGWLAAGSGAAGRVAVLRGVVWATLAVATLALLQYFGYDPLRTGAARPGASLGNPLLLAQWLGLSLPLCLLAALRDGRKLSWAGLAVLLGTLALCSSGARSSLLALLLVACGYGLWCLPLRHWTRLTLGLTALLLGGAALWSTLSWRPASVEHRLHLWQAAVDTIRDPPATLGPLNRIDQWRSWRPWTGYGADLAVLPLRAHGAVSISDFGADPDRAHQLLLDTVLRYGFCGLAAGLLACLWWWPRPSGDDDANRDFRACVRFALAVWLISLQSGFALTADSLLAALMVGAAAAPNAAATSRKSLSGRWSGLLLMVVAAAFWLLPPAWSGIGGWRRAETALLHFEAARILLRDSAAAPSGCSSARAAAGRLREAARLDPWRPEYPRFLSETEAALAANCQRTSQKQ